MGVKTKIKRNRAYVLLFKAGMPVNDIQRAFDKEDKRNIYRVIYRDWEKYELVITKVAENNINKNDKSS